MLRTAFLKRLFSIQPVSNRGTGQLDEVTEQIIQGRGTFRRAIRKQQQANVPAEMQIRNFQDSVVHITLYMRQDCWKSQFIYLMLNYHKLAFKRISDLVFLDRASYFLNLRKLEDSQRWPSVKVVVALEPKQILTGIDPICQFFKQNEYFTEQLAAEKDQLQSVQQFIDNAIVNNLESLFWHPMLTYQYSFHTNLSSYQDTSKSNAIFGIMGRNAAVVLQRIGTNLMSILKEGQRYSKSKQNLIKGLREIEKGCLEKQDFISGSKPGRLDFYLMSQIRTKTGSHLFLRFLERDVGGAFWSWWMRMSSLCQYSSDRITTL